MDADLTPEDLIAFEDEVACRFLRKEIKAPVHLSGGNETQLIELFRNHVGPDDWVLTTWRSHYHCLLKGVPAEELVEEIIAGRSISLCFPGRRILSSAIVAGCAPIAVGLGLGLLKERAGDPELKTKVVCFLGDMAAETGLAYESMKYSAQHGLPVLWVVEDNNLSAGTDTRSTWGGKVKTLGMSPGSLLRYEYQLTRPHVGVGQWVTF